MRQPFPARPNHPAHGIRFHAGTTLSLNKYRFLLKTARFQLEIQCRGAIVYCGKYGKSNSVFRIKTESGKDYFDRLNTRLEYPITDVTYKADKWTFKTNYPKQRFIISKEAYDDGWHVYSYKDGNKKELKTYLSTGGFVGFISEVGETSYVMEYVTPYRTSGVMVSWTAFLVYITSLLAYQRYTFEKEEKKRFILNKEKRA